MRDCYFTRQKMGYARGLATAIKTKKLVLSRLTNLPDEEIRAELKKLKGIGDWTVDVYLMHALQRSDLFPLGDIALVNSMREHKKLGKDFPKEMKVGELDKYIEEEKMLNLPFFHIIQMIKLRKPPKSQEVNLFFKSSKMIKFIYGNLFLIVLLERTELLETYTKMSMATKSYLKKLITI